MRLSRALAVAAGALLAGVLTMTAAQPASAAPAAAPGVAAVVAPGWYMLVDDYDYPAQPWHCLSTNTSTPPGGGAGTHQVYLAACNPDTVAQWWWLPESGYYNQLQNESKPDGQTWCLSRNNTTPQGGGTGTLSAYTAHCNASTTYQKWKPQGQQTSTVSLVSQVTYNGSNYCLSASPSNPNPGGTWRVYAAGCSFAGAQIWRPWAPQH